MKFNVHSKLCNTHSLLSPSKHHWINYDELKFDTFLSRHRAQQRGIELHLFAQQCIQLGQKLPRSRSALNKYVNDAIGFGMKAEQILFYSINSYGTTDAIGYRANQLRIHDLKTGFTKASMDQLMVYTALFCLEYDEKPDRMEIELRIYQGVDTIVHHPDPFDVRMIMDKIVLFDKKIDEFNSLE